MSSFIGINAITVDDDKAPVLEERFANRAHSVDKQPGFLGMKLLRPIAGEKRYFVITEWESQEDFKNWTNSRAMQEGHSKESRVPVASKAELLEFSVILESTPK